MWLTFCFLICCTQIYYLDAFQSVSLFPQFASAKRNIHLNLLKSTRATKRTEKIIPNFNPNHDRSKQFQFNHTLVADRLNLLDTASKEGKSMDFLIHLRFLANKLYPSFVVQNKLYSMLKTLKDYFSVQSTGSLFITLSEMGIRSNHSKFNNLLESYIDKFFEGNYEKTPEKILGFLVSMNKFHYDQILRPVQADINLPTERQEFIAKRRNQFLKLFEEVSSMEGINEKQFLTLSATIGQLTFRWQDLSEVTREKLLFHFHQNDRKFKGMYVPLLIYNLGRLEISKKDYEADFVCLLEMAEDMLEWVIQHHGKYKQNTIIVTKYCYSHCYSLLAFIYQTTQQPSTNTSSSSSEELERVFEDYQSLFIGPVEDGVEETKKLRSHLQKLLPSYASVLTNNNNNNPPVMENDNYGTQKNKKKTLSSITTDEEQVTDTSKNQKIEAPWDRDLVVAYSICFLMFAFLFSWFLLPSMTSDRY